MARKRMIDPNFWASEDVSKLTIFERLLFLGMVSNADDAGKGRANAAYLRSCVFPYDDMELDDLEQALCHIAQHTSVVLYEHRANRYYRFSNWNSWQKIDHPTQSKLPDPPCGVSRPTAPVSPTADGAMEETLLPTYSSKDDPDPTPFVPPTLAQVAAYLQERQSPVDPQGFLDYYASKGWLIGKTPMQDWKAACRSAEGWERWNRSKNQTGSKTYAQIVAEMERGGVL